MHVYYHKPDDQSLFVKLVREGLTELQAVNQLQLLGIEPNYFGKHDDFQIYYDYGSELFKQKKKNNLPYYYGKRRY